MIDVVVYNRMVWNRELVFGEGEWSQLVDFQVIECVCVGEVMVIFIFNQLVLVDWFGELVGVDVFGFVLGGGQ